MKQQYATSRQEDGERFDAIVLAGGRSSRMNGLDKARFELNAGVRLVDATVSAAFAAGAERVVVIGPNDLDLAPPAGIASERLQTAREEPPFGGPVAGLDAGLDALADPSAWARMPVPASPAPAPAPAPAPTILVLSCDLVDPGSAARPLRGALPLAVDSDGAVLDDGRMQWLVAFYRRSALARAVAALGNADGRAMRELVGSLQLDRVTVPTETAADIDSWHDVEYARRTKGPLMAEPLPPETLDEWVARLAPALGIEPTDVPIGTVLDLARDAAHGVARPAAPVTTFLLGLAAGAGRGSIADLTSIATELTSEWSASHATVNENTGHDSTEHDNTGHESTAHDSTRHDDAANASPENDDTSRTEESP